MSTGRKTTKTSLANQTREAGIELLEPISDGPWATVYAARDFRHNADLVVKSIKPNAFDPISLARYFECQRALVNLSALSLLGPRWVDETHGWLAYLRMSRSLVRFPRGYPIGFDQAREYLIDLFRTFPLLHEEEHRLHGAIRPSNLLLDPRGRLRVCDALGLPLQQPSCQLSPDDVAILSLRIGRTRGGFDQAVKYCASELINPGFGPVGKWLDYQNAGLAVYELLLGAAFEKAIPGVEAAETDPRCAYLRWANSPSPYPKLRAALPKAPEDLALVVDRLLEKNVNDRFQDPTDVLKLLGASPTAAAGATTTIHPAAALTPAPITRVSSVEAIAVASEQIIVGGPAPGQSLEGLPSFHLGNGLEGWMPPSLTPRRLIGGGACGFLLLLGLGLAVNATPTRQVRLTTNPERVAIAIDGRDVEPRTPATLDLPVGPHSFRLTLPGYHPTTIDRVDVVPGSTIQELPPVTLDPILRMARIETVPPDVTIRLDGVMTGLKTSSPIPLKLGSHRIELERRGYQTLDIPAFECRPGEGTLDLGVFTLTPKDRSVSIRSEPTGSPLRIDGGDVVTVTPMTLDLPVGPHRIALTHEGYQDREIPLEVIVGEGPQSVPTVRLEPVDRSVAVSVTSNPSGATISAGRDGQRITVTTPGTLRLRPGTGWSITAALTGHRAQTRSIDIDSSMSSPTVHFDLLAPSTRRLAKSGLLFVWIPGGEFEMGRDVEDQGPRHRVRLTRGYYMATHETTQAIYARLTTSNPSYFQSKNVAGLIDTGNHPVEQVSYHQALQFCRLLERLEGLREGSIRLPSEAEWEYAAGPSAENVQDEAWVEGNSFGKTRPVGRKRPNSRGLHDMHGNVREMTSDWYARDYYAESELNDPKGPILPNTLKQRVARGSSYQTRIDASLSTSRHPFIETKTDSRQVGFRIVLDLAD